ncbi:WD40-repeat-containing domain protein [Paraphysoderma sedebokerense]|nr:WD40-repeat-containing domain protein [Paraphysoderma sedebokerense]
MSLNEHSTLQRIDTVYSADSTEFCPHPRFRNVLAVGTYQLNQKSAKDAQFDSVSASIDQDQVDTENEPASKPAKRLGRCLLYDLQPADSENGKLQLNELSKIDMPAILDMKWSHSNTDPLLGIANASGELLLYKLSEATDNSVQMEHVTTEQELSSRLCLSLDWSNRVHPSNFITTSFSDGHIALYSVTPTSIIPVHDFLAHEFEAWITAFDYWNSPGNVIFSGGDDTKFKVWDVRNGVDRPVLVNKCHTAGVTSIHCHPHRENIIATGSYDETLNIYDTRKLRSPLVSTNLGGGVWRIKWHPYSSNSKSDKILTACMYNGFKIVDVDYSTNGDVQSLNEVYEFKEHNSIAYGADWWWGSNGEKGNEVIATCSFYDHLLCLWDIKL